MVHSVLNCNCWESQKCSKAVSEQIPCFCRMTALNNLQIYDFLVLTDCKVRQSRKSWIAAGRKGWSPVGFIRGTHRWYSVCCLQYLESWLESAYWHRFRKWFKLSEIKRNLPNSLQIFGGWFWSNKTNRNMLSDTFLSADFKESYIALLFIPTDCSGGSYCHVLGVCCSWKKPRDEGCFGSDKCSREMGGISWQRASMLFLVKCFRMLAILSVLSGHILKHSFRIPII